MQPAKMPKVFFTVHQEKIKLQLKINKIPKIVTNTSLAQSKAFEFEGLFWNKTAKPFKNCNEPSD